MSNNRGFILTRTLVALIIALTLLPISVYASMNLVKLKFTYTEINDEIALFQLRRILLISYDLNNYGNYLNFKYKGDECELSDINGRLVLTPGYQMFLDDIDELYFYEENECIYISYQRKDKEFKTPLVYARGIYIDEFSNNDDNFFDASISDE